MSEKINDERKEKINDKEKLNEEIINYEGKMKSHNYIEENLSENNDEISVVCDQHGSPTYTEDLTRIIYQAIEKNIPFGIYHSTNQRFTTWSEFTKKIFELSNIKTKVNEECKNLGIEFININIENISLPDEVEKLIDEQSGMGLVSKDMATYAQYQSVRAMRDASKQEGGLAGLGAGVALGNQMVNTIQQSERDENGKSNKAVVISPNSGDEEKITSLVMPIYS